MLMVKSCSVQNNFRNWSSRSLAGKWRHGFFYFLIRLGGHKLAYLFLYFIVFYFTLKPSVRKKASYYLARRFPASKGVRKFLDCYRLNLNFGKILIDRAILAILGEMDMETTSEHRKIVFDLLAEGKGLIMVTAHVGCWQLAMSGLDFTGVPVDIVYHHDQEDVDLQSLGHAKVSHLFHFIDPCSPLGGTLDMLESLKKGHVLCFMGDRVFGSKKNTVEVNFLGQKARFPISAFKIASVVGAPVVVVFAYRTGPSSGKMKLMRLIRIERNHGRNSEEYKPYVEEFVKALEGFVQEFPYQFFNFYDMWS